MENPPMGDWVQIPYDYAELWPHYAARALEYVRAIVKK